MRTLLSVLVALACLPPSAAQGEGRTEEETKPTPEAVQAMMKTFEEQGLEVDVEARTITVPAEIALSDMPLEYLLVHRRGKGMESLLQTEVKGSVLNAALLLLGYEPGRNARIVDKDPLPTAEEVAQGAPIYDIVPPEGMKLWFTLRWKTVGDDGEPVEHHLPVEDLIYDGIEEAALTGADWIYLGGKTGPLYRGEPPVYLADYDGNYISIVYKSPDIHIVTMRHERGHDDQNFWPNRNVPPPETPVELVIHATESPLHAERGKASGADSGKPPKKQD